MGSLRRPAILAIFLNRYAISGRTLSIRIGRLKLNSEVTISVDRIIIPKEVIHGTTVNIEFVSISGGKLKFEGIISSSDILIPLELILTKDVKVFLDKSKDLELMVKINKYNFVTSCIQLDEIKASAYIDYKLT